VTTFQNRKLIRDEIKALFNAYVGTGQPIAAAYNHRPSPTEVIGISPILYVTGFGTGRRFETLHTNPTTHRFLLSVMVMEYDRDASPQWFSEDAEDKLDDIEVIIAQVIRDSAGSLTKADTMNFESGLSTVESRMVEGQLYIVETRSLIAFLPKGSKP
jgi:hypothetical protein